MEKKHNHYLNVTLQNQEEEKDEIIVSLSGIFKQLKKFLLVWIVLAIIAGILVPVYYAIFATDQHKNLSAIVSFNYDGIESGKAPDGSTFDYESLKNPAVIEKALTNLNLDLTALENVRQGISITGIVPADVQDKITMYKSIYEQGNLTAGEKMLEVKVYPTQFRLTFNYSKTGLEGQTAVNLFNSILSCYSEYFFELYGFNQALGSAVTALDYTDYDYSQAIDVFDSTLSTLQDYVTNLSESDTTRFRATSTGYTFSDLSESIATLREVDLSVISSYITVNNTTKDKNTLLSYYNYRIETLNRQKKIAEDELKVVTDAIQNYVKDTIIIYGENQDTSEYTQASAAYDELITRKITAQKSVSSYAQQIDELQKRVTDLNGKNSASKDKIEKVEKDLGDLSTKITDLLQKVNDTANEYYETVYLANAYSVLVPASTSSLATTKSVIKSASEPIMIAEALLFVLYFGVSFVIALIVENKKQKELLLTNSASEDQSSSEIENITTGLSDKNISSDAVVITQEVPEAPEITGPNTIPSFADEEL